MARDLLTILKEVRGTGAPEAPYTDGIYHDIAIKNYNGNAGMYGDIVVKHSDVAATANITATNAANASASEINAKNSENQALSSENLASATISTDSKDIAVTKASEALASATAADLSAVSALDSKNIVLAKESGMMSELDYALKTSLVYELHKCGCNV